MNSVGFGLITGLSLPVIVFFLYFLFRIHSIDFTGYFQFLIVSKKMVNVLSLSVLPNLLPFMFFVNSSRFRAGRGMLGATILLAILIFVLKFTT